MRSFMEGPDTLRDRPRHSPRDAWFPQSHIAAIGYRGYPKFGLS